MNRSTLTLTTILALATSGCAGVGVQQASTFTAERGATLAQSDRGLDDLWNPRVERPTGPYQTVTAENVGSDLWNPRALVRDWETDMPKPEPKGRLSSVHTDMKF